MAVTPAQSIKPKIKHAVFLYVSVRQYFKRILKGLVEVNYQVLKLITLPVLLIQFQLTFFRQCHLPTVETPILINYKLTLLKLFITGYTDTQYLDSR